MINKYKKLRFVLKYIVGAKFLAVLKARELRCIQDNTNEIKKDDIICLTVLRNEVFRIPFFLDYYRKMGVDHFLFVDNDSTDGFQETVASEQDVSVWHTKGSYKKSRFGVDWTNYLLGKYGNAHWCLTVDPDEFLVYPHCKTRDLNILTEHLEYIGQEGLFCLLLDMYSDKKISETHYQIGQDPLEVAPWYDTDGYVVHKNRPFKNIWIQGGPRLNIFFKDRPSQAPALNKTPLVFWRRHYAYQSSTHVLAPRRLNKVHVKQIDLTGCLLHFKFISAIKEKAEEEVSRKQHFADSREYKKYLQGIEDENLFLMNLFSAKLNDPEELIQHGLMTTGGWF